MLKIFSAAQPVCRSAASLWRLRAPPASAAAATVLVRGCRGSSAVWPHCLRVEGCATRTSERAAWSGGWCVRGLVHVQAVAAGLAAAVAGARPTPRLAAPWHP